MIGKVYWSITQFYDSATKQMSFKRRPILIIDGPRNNDYTALPISTISKRVNLDPKYDIPIDPSQRAVLNLPRECFVRTHKQFPIHAANIHNQAGDMKNNLLDLYLNVLSKVEEYQQEVLNNAL